jgi:glyoxylase-like metal-dependent hydrolase (beta-lactamase superfamily II)
MTAQRPEVTGFFDHKTFSVQYVVADPATRRCAIVDPVLNYDEKAGRTSTEDADRILQYVADQRLSVQWILDTHPHADHFSAASYLKAQTGAPTAIGEHVKDVQQLWKKIYNWPAETPTDGRQWDRLFADGDTFRIGELEARVMYSPGHTLASITYVIADAAFVHDTLFQPDFGTARADFPGADAHSLYTSIRRILDELPAETRLFTGHDYMPGGREPQWESTVAEQREKNPHVRDGIDEATFVETRKKRDAELPMPALILHALQVNTNAGALPRPEDNGVSYLKIPINQL